MKSNEISEEVQPLDLVVTRKRGSGRLGKATGPTKFVNPTQAKAKGISDLSQVSACVEVGDDLSKSNQSDSTDSREETSRVMADQGLRNGSADPTNETTHAVAAQNSEINFEIRKDFVMEKSVENPYAECQQDMKHISGNKRKALAKNKGRGSESLGIRSSNGPKNSKSQK